MKVNTQKLKNIIFDVVFILALIAIGLVLRLPTDDTSRRAAEVIEFTDTDCFYLSDPDSYLYARKAREFSEDLSNFSFVNTRSEDATMNPVSTKEDGLVTNGLPLIAALIYRFLNLFTNISIEKIVYYLNAFICSLAAIPAYLYVRKQTNILGGIVSGLLAVVAIPFLEHSIYGYFDTDAMLCTVPLCLITSFSMMIYEEKMSKKVTYAVLSVILFTILASTWETFYIYFGILFALTVTTLIVLSVVGREKETLSEKKLTLELSFAGVTLSTMLLVSIAMYGARIFNSIGRLLNNMLAAGDYPDPTKYIVELSEIPVLENGLEGALITSGSGIINNLGGVIILIVALLSVILIILKGRKLSVKFLGCNMGFAIMWLVMTAPLLFVGVRFLQLICLPVVLLVGLGIGLFAQLIVNGSIMILGNEFSNKLLGYALAILISALVVIGPIAGGISRSNPNNPFYTKTFDNACKWINNNGAENSSIMTWWDYGYFIQCSSARHVLADGGTFDGGYFYWLAHAMLTDNPKLSVAIFNMLDAHGMDAPDLANKYIGNTPDACTALLNVLTMSKEEGVAFLVEKYNMPSENARKLMDVAKPNMTDERYFIISRDLIEKITALSYYGYYDFYGSDFEPVLAVSTEPVRPEQNIMDVQLRGLDNTSVICRQNEDKLEMTLQGENGSQVGMSRLIYVENGVKIRDDKIDETGYSVYCINDNGEYSFIVCSDFIADSMLVSLMAFNSNDAYTRVFSSVTNDSYYAYQSVTARFFGDGNTQPSEGALVYKVK